MPKENSLLKQRELIEKLEHIRTLANQCILEISNTSSKQKGLRQSEQERDKPDTSRMDFSLNQRAFVKRHAKQLSGPKKFVLILAYLAKGEMNKEISVTDIERLWKSMKGLIGMEFNTFYAVTAKDNGWVNSPKRGIYILADSWKEIFRHE